MPLPGAALLMIIIGISIILGGGGTSNPEAELLLQLLIVALMLPLCVSEPFQRGLGAISPVAWLIAALVLILPFAQLVPLPPSVWQALPGRELEVQSLALVGSNERWMPLSVAPARTFASLLSMIFPVLLLTQVSRLSVRSRRWLCATIAVGGGLSMLLGILQVSNTGGAAWSLYAYFSEGFLCGFQANRNHEADFLHIALLAFGALAAPRLMDGRRHMLTWMASAAASATLLIGVVMTGSRTGIALSGITVALLLVMFWPAMRKHVPSARLLVGGTLTVSVLLFGLLQLQSIARIVTRFSLAKEGRWDLWVDASYVLHQVWPVGAGIGTIAPVLQAAERLEALDANLPNRVHNDWFEWAIEAGAPGILALALVLLVLATMAYRAFRKSAQPNTGAELRSQTIFACGTLLILALHSIVDYPLRTMSLAMLAALAAGFLIFPDAHRQTKP